MKIASINQISKIGQEWAESVKNNPLKKGVARFVTIATDDLTETLGKTADGIVSLERKAKNGASELTLKHPEVKGVFKSLRFPDNSSCDVIIRDGIPRRTNGHFFLKNKAGEKVLIEYSADGYSEPSVHKNLFIENIDRLGDPRYNVDFNIVNSNKLTTGGKIKHFFAQITNIFEKNNKSNRKLREFANSIDKNA